MTTDRFRPPLPEDDNYDHDLDDPEFFHYGEETEDDWGYQEEDPPDEGGEPADWED